MIFITVFRIKICTNTTGCIEAELFDSYSPKTFKKIVAALPIESTAYRWGNEVYFSTPVEVEEENAREVVEKGTIAYWPPGRALCIFWGPTPASRTRDEIRPASPVNIVGRVLNDPSAFSKVRSGSKIRIEKSE
ncbi:MAG: cyclophilin-like fold protein [Ignisphaera sp.]